LLSTLNWRPVREIDREIEQIKLRTQRIEREIEQSRQRTRLIENETEQLRRENARERALSALIKQHCFPPECNSTPRHPTEPDCGPS
jgi:hypothetical protein